MPSFSLDYQGLETSKMSHFLSLEEGEDRNIIDESPCLGPFKDFPFLCYSFQDENNFFEKDIS